MFCLCVLTLVLVYLARDFTVMSYKLRIPLHAIFNHGNSVLNKSLYTVVFKRSTATVLFSSLSASTEQKMTDFTSDKAVSLLQDADKPRVIFVLGGPGAGKGTQCAKLATEFGMVHLSAGELLRAERASGSGDGQLIDSYIADGKIVPVHITLGCLRRAMESSESNRFLIDGFPRNWDNIKGWMDHMPRVCDVESVIFIDCPEAELERRLLQRGLTSGRTDDNIESARKRFHTYNAETLPVVLHYEEAGKLIRVSGAQAVESVHRDIVKAVEPYIARELLDKSKELLDAISSKDWATYTRLCAADMTAFEAEAKSHLVQGLPFHKFYFDVDGSEESVCRQSTIAQIRHPEGRFESTSFEETRVWQLLKGRWRCVHFHRSQNV